ncbi:MAG: hypothetical protein H7145_09005, partial [Akkermansiaceae bacterium]|nr:hypothetical protein [Armatimonadota bacterium]
MTLLRRPVTALCAATLTALSLVTISLSAFAAPQQSVMLSRNGDITA